jgi:hypothetical protein
MKTLSHDDILQLLRRAIREGWRALLVGGVGVGKTTMVRQAAEAEGVTGLEFALLSAPLIDPYTDLVGIPLPSTNGNRHVLTWARPAYFYHARVMLLDEPNRAQPKTVNAALELVQFGSLCGERLPNLRAVFVAGNEPGEGLSAEPFERALVDRVEVVIRFPSEPSRDYFRQRFPRGIADPLVAWWCDELDPEQRQAVSSRRLEAIGLAVVRGVDPELADTSSVVGLRVRLPWETLRRRLLGGPTLDVEDIVERPDECARYVERDMEVAQRFVLLLPRMKPLELFKVREVLLSLPRELLAALARDDSALWKRINRAVRLHGGPAEADALSDLLHARLGPA